MADRHTSIVTGDNLLEVYFQRQAIKTLHEKVHLYRLARKFPLPSGSGVQMTFNGWRKISAPSSTLAEASSNAAVNLSSRKVNITVASYGRAVKITDLAELTSIISPMQGAMDELMHSAQLALDNVIQLAVFKNVLAQVGQNGSVKTGLLSAWTGALASSFCANTGTTGQSRQFGFPVVFGTSTTRLSADDGGNISSRLGPIGIRKAVYRLRRLAVDPYASGSFVGVCHPNAIGGLFSNSDYKAYIVNYMGGPNETMFKDVISKVHNVELYSSPNMPRYASSTVSALPVFISGEGALGVTELGGGIEMIVKRPGPQTTSEPFNLNSYVSYKLRAAAAVLNPSCGVILMAHEGGV